MQRDSVMFRGAPARRTPVAWARGLALAAGLLLAASARAWVYPEHRDIALLAVQSLAPERRAAFDRLWEEARTGHESRLCRLSAFDMQGVAPLCLDWAALTAIAGDHACSSRQMLDTALTAPWILQVADVAAQLKADLARIPVVPPASVQPVEVTPETIGPDLRRRMQSAEHRAERLNALRVSDIRLQRADPGYATRAGANTAHFLLARTQATSDEASYGRQSVVPGAEINAVGVYRHFHLSALQKASLLARETLAPEARRALLLAALADEAFALHFLQDTFAAGHIAGTWGDASQRKGTHDYYNEHGLEIATWGSGGKPVVVMGDAHMRPEDAALAAESVRQSLAQVIDAAQGILPADLVPMADTAPAEAEGFDVCRNSRMPARPAVLQQAEIGGTLFTSVQKPTPVPALGAGLGAMPRFRAELGPFLGLAGTIDNRLLRNGFDRSQTERGRMTGLDVSLRLGLGLEGVIGDSGDGLVYASIGMRADSASTTKFLPSRVLSQGGGILAAVPARSGPSVRLRAPFFLVPGDLLLLSPLALAAPDAYAAMAVTASNGGLIPWQLGMATPVGRFQFVLGREVGITRYGHGDADQLIAPGATPDGPARLVSLRSTVVDLPLLEYRPYRAFAGNQSSSVLFQLYTSADMPSRARVVDGSTDPVLLRTIWAVGLRMVFDWRYYR
jgi:hypothetical protein